MASKEEIILKILRTSKVALTSNELASKVMRKLDVSKPTALSYIKKLVKSGDIIRCSSHSHKQKIIYVVSSPEGIKSYIRSEIRYVISKLTENKEMAKIFRNADLDKAIEDKLEAYFKGMKAGKIKDPNKILKVWGKNFGKDAEKVLKNLK